jgi:ABC-type multidrug transport system fused ATPase/permease subunit
MRILLEKCYIQPDHKADDFSLRENIAVVPQDPTLFSETIMTNLRYAKLTATKEEVYEACKSAEIHEKIMSMPDGQFCFQLKSFLKYLINLI